MTHPKRPTRRSSSVLVVVAVVAAVLTAVAALTVGSSTLGGPQPSATPPAAGSSAAATDPLRALERRTPKDPMAKGDVDAPVVMISYSEFQCPFCGRFANDTEQALVEKYVDAGTLRIEWRDFPYLGDESLSAAVAGRAAARQQGFWAFHDEMFADQQPPNSGELTEDHFVQIAQRAGLDGEQLRKDMTDPALAAAVREDFEEGQSIGVTGTPAFIVNGEPIIGAQPTEVFEQAIDRAAAAR